MAVGTFPIVHGWRAVSREVFLFSSVFFIRNKCSSGSLSSGRTQAGRNRAMLSVEQGSEAGRSCLD